MASKSYSLLTKDAGPIFKHKGPAKQLVNEKWFESQYADPSLTKQMKMTVVSNFRVDLHTLDIMRKEMQVSLGIKLGTKRDLVYDKNNIWVDTKPKEVIDFGGQDITIIKLDNKLLQDQVASLQDQVASQAQMIAKLEAKLEDKQQSAAKLPEVPVIGPKTESPILQPTRFNNPTEGNKGKSDKKLRRNQRRLNKKANQQPKPPKDKKPP